MVTLPVHVNAVEVTVQNSSYHLSFITQRDHSKLNTRHSKLATDHWPLTNNLGLLKSTNYREYFHLQSESETDTVYRPFFPCRKYSQPYFC